MSPVDPILDYGAFRRYRVPVRVVREVCDRHGLPRPKRIVRLKRGEVNALFRLDFDQKNPLICKIWVRPSGPEVMELHVSTVSRIHRETGVPTLGWLCISSGDDLIPYPYVVLEYIDGEDGDVLWRTLSVEQKQRLLAECAQIMLILHTSGIEAPGPTDASAWAATEIDRHRRCIQALRQQGWFNGRTLERVECAWDRRAASLSSAGQLSLVHYDFQLHNLRVDPASLKVLSVLDFDYVTQAPPFTDARDLVLSVFLRDPGLADTFWQEYGVLDEGQQKILALHSLGRLLDILAAYGGPTPFGWDAGMAAPLLQPDSNHLTHPGDVAVTLPSYHLVERIARQPVALCKGEPCEGVDVPMKHGRHHAHEFHAHPTP